MTIPVAIFGMGRFGRALAARLDDCGDSLVRLGGRGSAHRDGCPLVRLPEDFLRGLKRGTLIVISVRDDALTAVAAEFAALADAAEYRYVHTSGVSGLHALEPLAQAGAQTGVFHILQSLPPDSGAERIAGSYAAIAGPDALQDDLRRLAEHIGVNAVVLDESQWPAYHAAAVLASNALLGLLNTGREILAKAGLPEGDAEKMLLPLVQGTLSNAREHGLEAALTGPVVRGDVGTIKRHLETLQGDNRAAYIAVIQAVAALAESSGRTPAEKLQAIRDLIDRA